MTSPDISRRIGFWLGLLALSLQLALAPVFSVRAFAMAIDPLAEAALCLSAASDRPDQAPAGHEGHCDWLCLSGCAAHATPLLAEDFFDFDGQGRVEAPALSHRAGDDTALYRSVQQIRAPPGFA